MKIVYVYPSFWIASGADRIIVEKMNYLADVFKYDVTLITDSQCNRDFFFPLSSNVKHIDLNINFYQQYGYNVVRRYFVYKKLMKKYRITLEFALERISPDVTVCTCGRELDFLTSITDGSKKVGEAHTIKKNIRNFEKFSQKSLVHKLVVWWERKKQFNAIKKLDAFVVLTDNDAKSWTDVRKPNIIPNFIPFSVPTQSNCRNKSIISVGRFSYEKGYERLIQAWALIANKYPDWTINLYGDGELKDMYVKLCRDNHVENSFCFHDPVQNIVDQYIDSSMYVMTSRFEGLPMVLIEAMACGVPCISFNCPHGPRAIINDKQNGFLVKDGDVNELASKIEWMISHDIERVEMGRNAKESVVRFNKANIMLEWKKLFESL